MIGPYKFRGQFILTNHWSIPFPGKIRVDQWSRKFFQSFPLHWHWSVDGSSQEIEKLPRNYQKNTPQNTMFVYWGIFRGVSEAVFRRIPQYILFVGGYFCMSWVFPILWLVEGFSTLLCLALSNKEVQNQNCKSCQ